MPRPPAERGTNTGGSSDQRGWIAGAPGFLSFGYRVPRDVLDHGKHFANAVAATVAAVQCRGFAAAAQVGERLQMRVGQVLDVDVVTDAGAVRGWVVGAEDRHVRRSFRQRLRRLPSSAASLLASPVRYVLRGRSPQR